MRVAPGFGDWAALLRSLTADPAGERPEQALRAVVDVAPRLAGCRCAVLVLPPTSGLPATTLRTAGESGELAALDRARVLAEAQPLHRPAEEGGDSLLAVPVQIDGRTAGVLALLRAEPFTEADGPLAALIADTAAAIVRRRRLAVGYEQRRRWLAETADLTRSLLSGEPGNPLALVVDRVLRVADADLVAVVTARPDGRSFAVVEAAGDLATGLVGRVIETENTSAARVIAEGTPRVLTRLSTAPRRAELAEIAGAESAILVPLTGPGAEQGMLAVIRRPDKPAFTNAEVEATTGFAAQMTMALQLAESRAQRERVALLDERDRIARDLHDHVIQRLFAIGLTVQNAIGRLPAGPGDQLLAVVDGIDATIDQIRSTIYRLSTPILAAESSIRLQVGRLIDDLEPVLGLRPELELHGPVDLGVPDELTGDCVAVLREALTNVARHAAASTVSVRISADGAHLTLEVADDGQGIRTATRRSGLANLRARAERRGGRLHLHPGEPRGTRLVWTVPLTSS